MVTVAIKIDVPEGVTITGYERFAEGHGFEVTWPLPERCCCSRCKHEDVAHIEYKNHLQLVRDLEILGQPSFFVYQPPFHRCSRCGYRMDIIPTFRRKDMKYTYRFEECVLRMMIGSNEEDVGRRCGISAETVALIVKHQLAQARPIDPQRVIHDIGIDELSLKKRHKLYVTIMTDLTDPNNPQILAVSSGRDERAGRACLSQLSEAQRAAVKTYRVDMGAAYNAACKSLLPNAKVMIDRFHVAKKFNEVIDAWRKKITQTYKAKLTKAELKEFRSLMWEFRRRPEDLTKEEQDRLKALFARLPLLKELYQLRVRFTKIFDTALTATEAANRLAILERDARKKGLDLTKFFNTYRTHKVGILNYFEKHQTSAAVEGINNKARVVIKRAYGIKSADSLWNRLILDLNRASDVIGLTIHRVRELIIGIKAAFGWGCT